MQVRLQDRMQMHWQLAPSSRQSISSTERALVRAQGGRICTSPSLHRCRIRPLAELRARNRLGLTGTDCTCKTRRVVEDGSGTFRCPSASRELRVVATGAVGASVKVLVLPWTIRNAGVPANKIRPSKHRNCTNYRDGPVPEGTVLVSYAI